jgi:hypothetical protein
MPISLSVNDLAAIEYAAAPLERDRKDAFVTAVLAALEDSARARKTQFMPAPTIMRAAPMAISMATASHGGMGFRAVLGVWATPHVTTAGSRAQWVSYTQYPAVNNSPSRRRAWPPSLGTAGRDAPALSAPARTAVVSGLRPARITMAIGAIETAAAQ